MSVEMKDSGIAWIGEIPKHWEILPHKRVMYKIKDIQEQYNGEPILSLTMKGVIVRDLEAGGKMPTSFDGYQRIYPGNLLQCLFDIDVTPRCVGLIKHEGLTSPAYSHFELDSKACGAYYDYLLRYMDDEKCILHLSKNLRSSLTESDFGLIPTILPPKEEQSRIANFLDKKCAEIDELISLQEQMIAQLNTYKQAVITETVTKGLDPNVKMKDSGVEWIGEIPEHWETPKMKYYITLYSGDAISVNEFVDNGLYPVYGGGEKIANCNKFNTQSTDILIGRVGARCGCVTLPLQKCWATDNALILQSTLCLNYLYYMLIGANLNNLNTSNAQPLITGGKIKNLNIPLPLASEQQSIANYLDQKCKEIDELISIKKEKITLNIDFIFSILCRITFPLY